MLVHSPASPPHTPLNSPPRIPLCRPRPLPSLPSFAHAHSPHAPAHSPLSRTHTPLVRPRALPSSALAHSPPPAHCPLLRMHPRTLPSSTSAHCPLSPRAHSPRPPPCTPLFRPRPLPSRRSRPASLRRTRFLQEVAHSHSPPSPLRAGLLAAYPVLSHFATLNSLPPCCPSFPGLLPLHPTLCFPFLGHCPTSISPVSPLCLTPDLPLPPSPLAPLSALHPSSPCSPPLSAERHSPPFFRFHTPFFPLPPLCLSPQSAPLPLTGIHTSSNSDLSALRPSTPHSLSSLHTSAPSHLTAVDLRPPFPHLPPPFFPHYHICLKTLLPLLPLLPSLANSPPTTSFHAHSIRSLTPLGHTPSS
ncbi:unnamed protein product [Closterium sp. Naga37s-1]|nr:unnamed protein product [Closterium sp. Naga37s-1]